MALLLKNPLLAAPRARRCVVRASATPENAARRAVLIGIASAPFIASVQPALADRDTQVKLDAEGNKVMLGYAQSPDAYMGYADASVYNEAPKYSFSYPADWKVMIPTKTEKSTMGMDVRVVSPHSKQVQAFVVALTGPDYHEIVSNLARADAKAQLLALSTADPELSEAMREQLKTLTTKTSNTKKGHPLTHYDLESTESHWLSTVGIDVPEANMFALMVKAPAGAFKENEATLRAIQNSFQVL